MESKRRLVEDRVLPKLADVVQFATSEKIGSIKVKRRDDAVTLLLQQMAALDMDQLKRTLSELTGAVARSSGLRGWSDIILERDKPKK